MSAARRAKTTDETAPPLIRRDNRGPQSRSVAKFEARANRCRGHSRRVRSGHVGLYCAKKPVTIGALAPGLVGGGSRDSTGEIEQEIQIDTQEV